MPVHTADSLMAIEHLMAENRRLDSKSKIDRFQAVMMLDMSSMLAVDDAMNRAMIRRVENRLQVQTNRDVKIHHVATIHAIDWNQCLVLVENRRLIVLRILIVMILLKNLVKKNQTKFVQI